MKFGLFELICIAIFVGVYADTPSNDVYIDNVAKAVYTLLGSSVTSGQPWGGVTSFGNIITVRAGRSNSDTPAQFFLDGLGSTNVIGDNVLSDQVPEKLNFAIQGDLTMDVDVYAAGVLEVTCYDIRFGQGHYVEVTRFGQGHNNWWMGGPNCTASSSAGDSLSCSCNGAQIKFETGHVSHFTATVQKKYDLCYGMDPAVSGPAPGCHKQNTCDFNTHWCAVASECLVDGSSFEQACVYTALETLNYDIPRAQVILEGQVQTDSLFVENCMNNEQLVVEPMEETESVNSEWHWDVGVKVSISGELTEEVGIPFVEETDIMIKVGFEIDVSGGHSWTHTSSTSRTTSEHVAAPPNSNTTVSMLCAPNSNTTVSMLCAHNKVNIPYIATFQGMCRVDVVYKDSLKAPSDQDQFLTCVQKKLQDQSPLVGPVFAEHLNRTGTFKSAQTSVCHAKFARALADNCTATRGLQVTHAANATAKNRANHPM